jgi:hypothetical protein
MRYVHAGAAQVAPQSVVCGGGGSGENFLVGGGDVAQLRALDGVGDAVGAVGLPGVYRLLAGDAAEPSRERAHLPVVELADVLGRLHLRTVCGGAHACVRAWVGVGVAVPQAMPRESAGHVGRKKIDEKENTEQQGKETIDERGKHKLNR